VLCLRALGFLDLHLDCAVGVDELRVEDVEDWNDLVVEAWVLPVPDLRKEFIRSVIEDCVVVVGLMVLDGKGLQIMCRLFVYSTC
jgi:hypothetical protein